MLQLDGSGVRPQKDCRIGFEESMVNPTTQLATSSFEAKTPTPTAQVTGIHPLLNLGTLGKIFLDKIHWK